MIKETGVEVVGCVIVCKTRYKGKKEAGSFTIYIVVEGSECSTNDFADHDRTVVMGSNSNSQCVTATPEHGKKSNTNKTEMNAILNMWPWIEQHARLAERRNRAVK